MDCRVGAGIYLGFCTPEYIGHRGVPCDTCMIVYSLTAFIVLQCIEFNVILLFMDMLHSDLSDSRQFDWVG